jgi:hypothetical protein
LEAIAKAAYQVRLPFRSTSWSRYVIPASRPLRGRRSGSWPLVGAHGYDRLRWRAGVPLPRHRGAPLPTYDYWPAEFPPLFEVAERLGVSVSYLPFAERYRGYYRPSENAIVLCSHDVSVFFHELAHAAHNRVCALRGGQVPAQEIVAETVAAVLCRLYGHDGYLWHGAEYVRGYANGQNPGRAALRLLADVQAVLDLILDPWGEQKAAESAAELAAA